MGPLETVGNRVVVGWRFRMKAVCRRSAVTNGKPSSSYRMAFCVEHATYN